MGAREDVTDREVRRVADRRSIAKRQQTTTDVGQLVIRTANGQGAPTRAWAGSRARASQRTRQQQRQVLDTIATVTLDVISYIFAKHLRDAGRLLSAGI